MRTITRGNVKNKDKEYYIELGKKYWNFDTALINLSTEIPILERYERISKIIRKKIYNECKTLFERPEENPFFLQSGRYIKKKIRTTEVKARAVSGKPREKPRITAFVSDSVTLSY